MNVINYLICADPPFLILCTPFLAEYFFSFAPNQLARIVPRFGFKKMKLGIRPEGDEGADTQHGRTWHFDSLRRGRSQCSPNESRRFIDWYKQQLQYVYPQQMVFEHGDKVSHRATIEVGSDSDRTFIFFCMCGVPGRATLTVLLDWTGRKYQT